MKIFLEKAIFINRAPFEKLELDFNENEIAVLTAINGKGKTTILSHITDAFYEMAKSHFPNEFEDKENKFYRVSSSEYNLNKNLPSFVYLRFKTEDSYIDYIDIRNKCTIKEYNEAITIEGKIEFDQISSSLKEDNTVKKVSSNFDKPKAKLIFGNNILTFFPSYRFEMPGYLNDPYKINLDFKKQSGFSGYLLNPIEVVSGLPQLANWILDIVLDIKNVNDLLDYLIFQNLNTVISNTLSGKISGNLSFAVGPRNFGSTRIQIYENKHDGTREQIYPSIFNLSSGESSMLCLFGELLRQADNIKNNIPLSTITGIVLIDEIDKHLHIKLQKEILPKLFNLFPNVQFIVSSHSPFLSMGLAETLLERTKIIDLDNGGISKDPTNNELYKEVYDMMINENDRFKDVYESLKSKIQEGTTPLIITEGKTDIIHIKKAKEKLNINDIDFDYFEIPEIGWGFSALKTLLENLCKIDQARKVIGIFDRDEINILKEIEKDDQPYKNFNNNVYAFCIPVPVCRQDYTKISIEFYYSDLELKKEKDGKSLYFDNEIDELHNKSTKKTEIRRLDNVRLKNEFEKKVFCNDIGDSDWIHSKSRFAELIEKNEDFISDFNFDNFNLIFEKIRLILNENRN